MPFKKRRRCGVFGLVLDVRVMRMGVLSGCFAKKHRFGPGLPGGSIIYRGNPSIVPKGHLC